jgi:hypothetical protein
MVNRPSAHTARVAHGLALMSAVLLVAGVRGADTKPPELQPRTTEYVRKFFNALANVVGQEDFQSRDKKVMSDVLLVRYPGSNIDLLVYRDVVSVNGGLLPNRPQHLLDLFQADFDSAVGRANQISTDSGQHVPPILNPLFGIAFLQPHYQSRFKMDERNADSQWPRHTKLLTFIETTKPTLLRSGLMRDIDVPTRGTAWVEEETGRVLQTEVLIRHPDGVTTIKTTFTMDPRLQLMVPASMQAQKPDGRAAYSNFRRFIIQVDEAVKAGFAP